MPNVVASLYHDLTSPTTNPPSWALNGNNWIVIFMAILVPVCFLRDLNSLRHTSYIALFSVGEWGFLWLLRDNCLLDDLFLSLSGCRRYQRLYLAV
jgi:amino acid permease